MGLVAVYPPWPCGNKWRLDGEDDFVWKSGAFAGWMTTL